MKLNIDKVYEYCRRHGSLMWHDEFINHDYVINDNEMIIKLSNEENFTFRVDDDKVLIEINRKDGEESLYMAKEFTYTDNKVLYKFTVDKNEYKDIKPESGKDIPLEHTSWSNDRVYNSNEIMSIDELYTPLKIK